MVDGGCERCGTITELKPMKQWMLRITSYANKMLEGLEDLEGWEDKVKTMQANWIGKTTGATIAFRCQNGVEVNVFTTEPETIYGVTAIVLAPDHVLVDKVVDEKHKDEVIAF